MSQTMQLSAQAELWLKELLAFSDQSRILQEWEPVSYLDKGTFSRIFLVQKRSDNNVKAALKFVPNPEETDCAPEGSEQDLFFLSRFMASQKEAEIMRKFRGKPNVVQYIGTPEFLTRRFRNSAGVEVIQYAVLICMPLYADHKRWLPEIANDREKRIRLGMDIARSLESFEAVGVYHRDIKPGNIMRDSNGSFLLGDIGEAKPESEQTTYGYHGTPPYMAPEVRELEMQLRKKQRSDHRSDIYSLGIVLYRLFNKQQFPYLTSEGTLTHEATVSYDKFKQKTGTDSEYLTASQKANILRYGGGKLPKPAEADDDLGKVILRACAYNIKERYQNATELYEDLEACLMHRRPKPKKHGKLILTALLSLVLVGALAIFIPKLSANISANQTVNTNVTTTAAKGPLTNATEQTTAPVEVVYTEEPQANHNLFDIEEVQGGVAIVGYNGEIDSLAFPAKINDQNVVQIGSDTNHAGFAKNHFKNVQIPSGVERLSVGALAGCMELETVVLPDTLVSIGESAFYGVPNLEKLSIPASVKQIGSGAFRQTNVTLELASGHPAFELNAGVLYNKKTKSLVWYPTTLKNEAYTVQAGTLSIEPYAFDHAKVIAVILPESMKEIGKYAFIGSDLQSIDIPDSVTKLGQGGFYLCDALQTVRLPKGLKEIPAAMFMECKALTTIEHGESITQIGENAFLNCPAGQAFQ